MRASSHGRIVARGWGFGYRAAKKHTHTQNTIILVQFSTLPLLYLCGWSLNAPPTPLESHSSAPPSSTADAELYYHCVDEQCMGLAQLQMSLSGLGAGRFLNSTGTACTIYVHNAPHVSNDYNGSLSICTRCIFVCTNLFLSKSSADPTFDTLTPCGTRTRNLRITSPTPCPLGQGGLDAHATSQALYKGRACQCMYARLTVQVCVVCGMINNIHCQSWCFHYTVARGLSLPHTCSLALQVLKPKWHKQGGAGHSRVWKLEGEALPLPTAARRTPTTGTPRPAWSASEPGKPWS